MNPENKNLDNFFMNPDDEFLDKELKPSKGIKEYEPKKPFSSPSDNGMSRNAKLISELNGLEEDINFTNQKPKLLSKGVIHADFLEVVQTAHYQIDKLPCLNYSDVYQELIQLTVKNISTPTLAEINSQLERVQSSKDRITELDILITQCFLMKERILDILKDSLQKYSVESTADKRKGDAAYLLFNFEMDFAKLEGLQKACKYIMMNLVSLQESISRRITTIQLQIKLNDIGRSSFGDFDVNNRINQNDRMSAKDSDSSYGMKDSKFENPDLPESANEFDFK